MTSFATPGGFIRRHEDQMPRPTLADLMRTAAPGAPVAPASAPPQAGPDLPRPSPAGRKPGHWRRGDGTQVPISAMNDHHRAAAARKARAAGDDALADELEGKI